MEKRKENKHLRERERAEGDGGDCWGGRGDKKGNVDHPVLLALKKERRTPDKGVNNNRCRLLLAGSCRYISGGRRVDELLVPELA